MCPLKLRSGLTLPVGMVRVLALAYFLFIASFPDDCFAERRAPRLELRIVAAAHQQVQIKVTGSPAIRQRVMLLRSSRRGMQQSTRLALFRGELSFVDSSALGGGTYFYEVRRRKERLSRVRKVVVPLPPADPGDPGGNPNEPNPTPTPGPTPSATPSQDPNLSTQLSFPGQPLKQRGSLGINLSEVADWSTALPFLDQMKLARPWQDWNVKQYISPQYLDENDWVTHLPVGVRAGTVFLCTSGQQVQYSRYVVRYKGDLQAGKVLYSWAAKKLDAQSTPGRDVIEITPGCALLEVESPNPANYIRDITIVPEVFVDRFDKGEFLNPDWFAKLKQFRAVRFMDWMHTNWSKVSSWAQRPKVEHRLWSLKGVPLEILVATANTLKADPWFNMPHLTNEDFWVPFVSYVKTHLDETLTPSFEYSNEVWNFGFGGPDGQAQYAYDQAAILFGGPGGPGWINFASWMSSRLCQSVKQIYADRPDSVECILPGFIGGYWLASHFLECPLAVQYLGAAPCYQAGFKKFSLGHYVSGCMSGVLDDDPNSLKSQNAQSLISSWITDPVYGPLYAAEQIRSGLFFECGDNVQSVGSLVKQFAEQAALRGLQLVAYEGGQHLIVGNTPEPLKELFNIFHAELNRHPVMKDVYTDHFNAWKDNGGGPYYHFSDIFASSISGHWGALESVTQKTSPKWQALTAINEQDCWWPGCEE